MLVVQFFLPLSTCGKSKMKFKKLFYIFGDPLGANDSKVGVTGHPEVRLGVYQNSYSRNSHTACFNIVYVGDPKAISNLEKAVKKHFDWDIERDGRGHSDWVNNQSVADIEGKVDEIIKGYKFKVKKVAKRYLSVTVDNLDSLLEQYDVEDKL